MNNKAVKKSTQKKLCPFLKDPSDACYCTKLNSQFVEKAIYFCGNNFDKCEIFANTKNMDNKTNNNHLIFLKELELKQ